MEDIRGEISESKVNLEINQEKVPIKVRKPVGKTVLFVFLSLFLLLVISYAGLTIASTGKSLPYLNLVGTPVGNRSKTEIFISVKQLSQTRLDQKVNIRFNDSNEEKSFKDLGLVLNLNESVEKIFNFGKIRGIFPSPQYILATASGSLLVQPLTSWNEESSKQISDLVVSKKKNAQNPTVQYADGQVSIQSEQDGYSYMISELKSDLEVCYLKKSCDSVKANQIVLKSSITSSQLSQYKDQISNLVDQKLNLEYGNHWFTIKPEDIAMLFQPFGRIGADKTEAEGTGLGLMVVKKLTEAMGGTVGVESEPDAGSTFWIELPFTKNHKTGANQISSMPTPELPATKHAVTILYIEDNLSNIELVEGILTDFQPEIRLVTSIYGRQTIKLAKEYKPCLILLDLDLPDVHGVKVLEKLLADSHTVSIPVIIISADAMPHQVEKLMKAGAVGYLTKPLDVNQFLKTINQYIKN